MRGSKGSADGVTLKAVLAPEFPVSSVKVPVTIASPIKFSLYTVLLHVPLMSPLNTSAFKFRISEPVS